MVPEDAVVSHLDGRIWDLTGRSIMGISQSGSESATMFQIVQFMSQRDAESWEPAPDSALISITDPGAEPACLRDGWVSVLRLAFDDIDPRLCEPDEDDFTPISPGQAAEIARHVGRADAGCRVLVIHCRFGQSRSAAVARAVAEVKRLPIPPDCERSNPFVYERVKEALLQLQAGFSSAAGG